MTNENSIVCVAKQFCDGLWENYTRQYPEFVVRINPIFVHLAIYQHLVSHRSIKGSKGRRRQQELVDSFEQWYEGIEHARSIDWINLYNDVLDTIQGETGDYNYGFDGSFIRDYELQQAWESSINHQLFQTLPTSNSLVEESNLNLEVVRQIEIVLEDFVPSPIITSIPGEQELFSLIVDDVSRLLIGSPREADESHLGSYLYLFQCAVFGNDKSKQECAQLASLIETKVKSIQSEGVAPHAIDSFWQMGLGYSNELVKDYNQLISMLSGQVFTVHREDVDEGVELSIWRYPEKDETLKKFILRGDGRYELTGEHTQHFDDARAVVKHLMSKAANKY
ncbi:hypothetical protein [Vibrio neonatus]|uniref:hypothetical protein n=1 Tax=Vibrio neonatus TaxID=278860 RepID=UPI0021C425FB|nr:hypothetical protein [Vibrio neonatus]